MENTKIPFVGNTVATASEMQKIAILTRRYNVIEALEFYREGRLRNTAINTNVIRARMLSYFTELQAMLYRRMKKEEYDDILDKCMNSSDEKTLIQTIFRLNVELDKILLTRIDNQLIDESIREV